MHRDMKEWVSGIVNSKKRQAMPIMNYPGLELIGKTVPEIINNGESQYQCIKVLADRFPSIGAGTIMDLSVEAESFGSPVKYSAQDVPTVTAAIITDLASAGQLKVPEVGSGRTLVYLTAAELAANNIKDRPVFGGMIGPFSLAARLYDITKLMMALILDSEIVRLILDKATEFLINYSLAFKETGVNGLIIAEPATGLISPDQSWEFSYHYIQRIIEASQDADFMIILHNCGNTKQQATLMAATGAMGLHFGNAVDMAEILPQTPKERLVFGNIDPAKVFKNGTVAEMKEQTGELLERTTPYKNFVLSSGCDVPPGAPLKNIEAFYESLNQYNQKIK